MDGAKCFVYWYIYNQKGRLEFLIPFENIMRLLNDGAKSITRNLAIKYGTTFEEAFDE
jgi:hypothetical protein